MDISNVPSVGVGDSTPKLTPAPSQQTEAGQTTKVSTTTTTSSNTTLSASSIFASQSPLRSVLERMTNMELALLILDVLLNKSGDEDKKDEYLAGLVGLLALADEGRQRTFFASNQSTTTNHTISTQQVVEAYTQNTVDPNKAADPSASPQSTTTPPVDTQG